MKYHLICQVIIFYRKGESARHRDRVELFYDITKIINSSIQLNTGDYIETGISNCVPSIYKITHNSDLQSTYVKISNLDIEIDKGKEYEILSLFEKDNWVIQEIV